MRSLFAYLSRPHDRARRAAEHYKSIAAQARLPEFFESHAAPDTLDGRFDVLVLLASLYLKRLRAAGPDGHQLAQAVFDHMFSTLDQTLRELGVGDVTIHKKIRAMASAFYGRAAVYDKGLADHDDAALADAIVRNIFAGKPPQSDRAVALWTSYLKTASEALATASDETMVANQFQWPNPLTDAPTN